MRKLIIIFCFTISIIMAKTENSGNQWTAILDDVSKSSHRYYVILAYVPIFTEGAANPAMLYDAAIFKIRVQTLAWKSPIDSLNEILAKSELELSQDPGRWAAGVRIEDRTSSEIVFSMEISVPIHVVAINGVIYKTNPDIIEWFRRELLPAVKTINKGYPIDDL